MIWVAIGRGQLHGVEHFCVFVGKEKVICKGHVMIERILGGHQVVGIVDQSLAADLNNFVAQMVVSCSAV